MSFDLSYSFSDRLKKKRNVLLYNAAQETKYEKKQRSSYEQMRSIDQGETVFHEECPDVPWCGSTSPDLFIFKVMMNDPTQYLDLLQHLPIINREGSFQLETNLTLESNYVVVRVRCIILRTDSLCDGISFYDIGSSTQLTNYYNTQSQLEIIQFGNIPLSRQGSQFRGSTGLRIQFRNTIPVILPNTSFNHIFENCSMTSLNITSWEVENVISMNNSFTNCPNLVLNLSGWNVTIPAPSPWNAPYVTAPVWVVVSSTGPFVYRCILNEGVPQESLESFIPIINTDESFELTTTITTDGPYTVVSVACVIVSTTSPRDGISFYDEDISGNQLNNVYNENTTALEILQFGNIPLSRNGLQFQQLTLTISSSSAPVILPNTSLSRMFSRDNQYGVTTLTVNNSISSWNVSNVINMGGTFAGCSSFNKPLSWNVSNVIFMNDMFDGCSQFNQNISSWNVSNVTNMEKMFRGCSFFNQTLSEWSTRLTNVTTMSEMFSNCVALSANFSSWNVPAVNAYANFSLNTLNVVEPTWVV